MEIYQRIFEHSPDAVVVIDGDGYITKVNYQTEIMFGYNRKELIGQAVEILIPQRFSARHVGHRSSYLSGPRLRPMGAGLELHGKRKDGSEFPVDIMLSPLETNEGVSVMGVVRDITERKQVEQRIIDSLREKEALVAKLQLALNEIKTLRGLIPICAWCKKVRNDDGFWQGLENYLCAHMEADFTHSICPSCLAERHREIDEMGSDQHSGG